MNYFLLTCALIIGALNTLYICRLAKWKRDIEALLRNMNFYRIGDRALISQILEKIGGLNAK